MPELDPIPVHVVLPWSSARDSLHVPCVHATQSAMCHACMSCIHAVHTCHGRVFNSGRLHDVIGKLGAHICLHVLVPLLKLHPHKVHFRTHLQRDEGEGSYTIEVSYRGSASQQEDEEQCSVESAALQCLQVLKRECHPLLRILVSCTHTHNGYTMLPFCLYSMYIIPCFYNSLLICIHVLL